MRKRKEVGTGMQNEELIKILKSYPNGLEVYISDVYNEPECIDEVKIDNDYGKEVIVLHCNC